jgi:hypothetical protein
LSFASSPAAILPFAAMYNLTPFILAREKITDVLALMGPSGTYFKHPNK